MGVSFSLSLSGSATPASEMIDALQSVAEVASVMWQATRDWPAKYGADLREDFGGSFRRSIEEVFDEMVYFLAFATDYALWCRLEKTPQVQNALRSVFTEHVRQFAQERSCPPIPSGDWLGGGLIWMPAGAIIVGEPLANLKRRFDLYAQSLLRRHDRSAGERTAHILAAFCGTMDAIFIVYATPLFLGRWNGVRDVLSVSAALDS
jgi:hypothetical protein